MKYLQIFLDANPLSYSLKSQFLKLKYFKIHYDTGKYKNAQIPILQIIRCTHDFMQFSIPSGCQSSVLEWKYLQTTEILKLQ